MTVCWIRRIIENNVFFYHNSRTIVIKSINLIWSGFLKKCFLLSINVGYINEYFYKILNWIIHRIKCRMSNEFLWHNSYYFEWKVRAGILHVSNLEACLGRKRQIWCDKTNLYLHLSPNMYLFCWFLLKRQRLKILL